MSTFHSCRFAAYHLTGCQTQMKDPRQADRSLKFGLSQHRKITENMESLQVNVHGWYCCCISGVFSEDDAACDFCAFFQAWRTRMTNVWIMAKMVV